MPNVTPLRPGVTARAEWVLPSGVRTAHPEAAASATHRPLLSLRWRSEGLTLAVVGMNPSAATESALDPTVRAMFYHAIRLRLDGQPFAALDMVNLYDRRQTSGFKAAPGAVEVGSDRLADYVPARSVHWREVTLDAVQAADVVVFACGSPARWEDLEVLYAITTEAHAWRLTNDGKPKHPRGQPRDLVPSFWGLSRSGETTVSVLTPDPALSLVPEPAKPKAHRLRYLRHEIGDRPDLLTESDLLTLWRHG